MVCDQKEFFIDGQVKVLISYWRNSDKKMTRNFKEPIAVILMKGFYKKFGFFAIM
jgi:hypothetical protein